MSIMASIAGAFSGGSASAAGGAVSAGSQAMSKEQKMADQALAKWGGPNPIPTASIQNAPGVSTGDFSNISLGGASNMAQLQGVLSKPQTTQSQLIAAQHNMFGGFKV